MSVDKITRRWICNETDERAAALGMRFDEQRADMIVKFFSRNLRLYEGVSAGLPFIPLDWAANFLMRLNGWVKQSEHWGREIRRYRKFMGWVPKKNTKSPVLAGLGLFLLIIESQGEPGQHIRNAARDGKQARIAWNHSKKMVESSGQLADMCRINSQTGMIHFDLTDSDLGILAGENIKGQEGLNGSVLIDECHVVDSRLAQTLEHMGASRLQPLVGGLSTFGDDVESWGHQQLEYGESVESGETEDYEFLHVCYAALRDATDEQLLNDEKIRIAANPAWGKTINPEEFVSSMRRAYTLGGVDWEKFKQYRFNIWTSGLAPAIPVDAWVNRCAEEFTEARLHGEMAWVGIDLAKSLDMAAVVLAVPFRTAEQFEPETIAAKAKNSDDGGDDAEPLPRYELSADLGIRLLPYFWFPENRAREFNHRAPFLKWAEQGALFLSPGDTIEQDLIYREIERLAGVFRIAGVFYDAKYADDFTLRLERNLGLYREEFPQTMMTLAGPWAAMKRLILQGRLKHGRHPVLSWQARNAQTKSDNNDNERIVKPKYGDFRKVDGIIAAKMAIAAAIRDQGTFAAGSYYDDHELESA